MKTLYARLSFALFGILFSLGLVFYLIESHLSTLYHEELTQRLNAPIAMYVVGEHPLIENGAVDEQALSLLANQAMVINPSVEIYLLDPQGEILAHGLPADAVQLQRVDLEPIRNFMREPESLPIKGEDPRNPARHKVFSVAPIEHDGELQAYLYAILGGATYDALATDIGASYARKTSATAILLLALAAFMAGLIVFGLLTGRLRRLGGIVQEVAQGDFRALARQAEPAKEGDELNQLEHLMWRMSGKIDEQFERLRETDRLRRELIANVSHDLRTPLASMQGYIETLIIKDERLSVSERREYLHIARKHTKRLGELISDLFDLSRLDANSVQPNFESFSLAELVQDLIHEFQLQAEQQQVALHFETPKSGETVYADIGLIQRVLENLIKNALQHTPAGGEVRLQLQRQPQVVSVAVQDTGHGIAEADIPRVFDRFYRAKQGEESRSDSSGLGLAIVKKILDLHDSQVSIESHLNSGTCIAFDLATEKAAA